jgi:hypothetical protein
MITTNRHTAFSNLCSAGDFRKGGGRRGPGEGRVEGGRKEGRAQKEEALTIVLITLLPRLQCPDFHCAVV